MSILNNQYPLNNTWCYWIYDNANEKAVKTNWEDSLHIIHTSKTIHEYWQIIHTVRSVDRLSFGDTVFFFKEGIKPMWEDEANRYGGAWILFINNKPGSKSARSINNPVEINTNYKEHWDTLLMTLIGDILDESTDEITGVMISFKYSIKIQIWTKSISNKVDIMKIGKTFKDIFHVPDDSKIHYKTHNNISEDARKAPSKYTI